MIVIESIFFFKQKTAYDMRISDWSSDVCSSDLLGLHFRHEIELDRIQRHRSQCHERVLDQQEGEDHQQHAALEDRQCKTLADEPADRLDLGDDHRNDLALDRKSTRLNSSH